MNAGRILRRAGLDTDELRVTLLPVNPDRVNIWPASRLMMATWRQGIKGVTYGRVVFVNPEMFHAEPKRLASLVIHELVHVRQFHDRGYVGFSTRYVTDYVKGRVGGKSARQAYLDVTAEVEARQIAARLSKLA